MLRITGREAGHGKRGFTLIELTIVLVVAGLLFAGLWRLLSGGNQQVRDQSAASLQQQLISATKNYLASTVGQATLTGKPGGGTYDLPLPAVGAPCVAGAGQFCSYLPTGFNVATANSYGQTFKIEVLKDGSPAGTAANTYSFLIMTTGGEVIPDTSGGRISAFIGNDGGFIYNSAVCNAAFTNWACGAYGTWTTALATYGITAASVAPVPKPPATGGYIASRTYVSPSAGNTFPWLERNLQIQPDPTFTWNTMTTDLYMGGTSSQAAATYSGIYLVPPALSADLVAGNATGSINLGPPNPPVAGGKGVINVQNGTINLNVPTPTTDCTTAGGCATINLQGGAIVGNGGTGNINLTSCDGKPGSPCTKTDGATTGIMVDLSGAATPIYSVLSATNGCLIATDTNGVLSYALPSPPYAGPPAPAPFPPGYVLVTGTAQQCNYSLSVDNLSASGLIKANYFYSNTAIYASSDIRLKSNVQPLVDPLDDVMRLNPVSFNYKSTGASSLGVIAQDLEKVYPQLVITNSDNGMKGVNYIGLIGPLIGAVQELKHENDDLRHRLKAQEQRENVLEQEIKDSRPQNP